MSRIKISFFVLLSLFVLLFTGCGGGGGGSDVSSAVSSENGGNEISVTNTVRISPNRVAYSANALFDVITEKDNIYGFIISRYDVIIDGKLVYTQESSFYAPVTRDENSNVGVARFNFNFNFQTPLFSENKLAAVKFYISSSNGDYGDELVINTILPKYTSQYNFITRNNYIINGDIQTFSFTFKIVDDNNIPVPNARVLWEVLEKSYINSNSSGYVYTNSNGEGVVEIMVKANNTDESRDIHVVLDYEGKANTTVTIVQNNTVLPQQIILDDATQDKITISKDAQNVNIFFKIQDQYGNPVPAVKVGYVASTDLFTSPVEGTVTTDFYGNGKLTVFVMANDDVNSTTRSVIYTLYTYSDSKSVTIEQEGEQ